MFLNEEQAVLYRFQLIFTMAPKVRKALTTLIESGYHANSRVTEYLEDLYKLNHDNKTQLERVQIAIEILFTHQPENLTGHTITHGLFLKSIYAQVRNKQLMSGFLADAIRFPSEPIIAFLEHTVDAKQLLLNVCLDFQRWKPKRLDRFLATVPGLINSELMTSSTLDDKIINVLSKHVHKA